MITECEWFLPVTNNISWISSLLKKGPDLYSSQWQNAQEKWPQLAAHLINLQWCRLKCGFTLAPLYLPSRLWVFSKAWGLQGFFHDRVSWTFPFVQTFSAQPRESRSQALKEIPSSIRLVVKNKTSKKQKDFQKTTQNLSEMNIGMPFHVVALGSNTPLYPGLAHTACIDLDLHHN